METLELTSVTLCLSVTLIHEKYGQIRGGVIIVKPSCGELHVKEVGNISVEKWRETSGADWVEFEKLVEARALEVGKDLVALPFNEVNSWNKVSI